MTKIVIFSNQYPPHFLGGDANSCRLLSEELVKRGWDVTVVTIARDKKISDYRSEGVDVRPVSYSKFKLMANTSGYLSLNGEEMKILKEVGPDLIHLQNFSGFGLGLLKNINKHTDVPLLMTVRDNWLVCPSRAEVRKCERGCFGCEHNKYKIPIRFKREYIKKIDMMIFPSRTYQQMHKGQYGDDLPQSMVIPNFTRDWPNEFDFDDREVLRQKMGIGKDDTVVLYIGHLIRAKGFDSLLRASNKMKGVKFVFAGLDKEGILEHTPDRRNILSMGFLPSFSEELYRLYHIADVFLLPTRWDNCPLTVIEAMSFGLPVLATRVGGVPELVKDGVNGRLFELRDLSKLDTVLKRFIEEEDLVSMGGKSRKIYEKEYSVDAGMERYLRMYKKLIR